MSVTNSSHMPFHSVVRDRASTGVSYHVPDRRDGARMWRLARASGTLDVNSPYMYLLGASHFAGTSVVARDPADDDELAGFVFGYRRPDAPDVVFVWQIAVADTHRGRGVGRGMLDALVDRLIPVGCRYLECSVTPDNLASHALFTSFARTRGAPLSTGQVMFAAADFDASTPHEPELLYRIGPLPAAYTDHSGHTSVDR